MNLKKEYDKTLFSLDFEIISNTKSLHDRMCALMDADPKTEEMRFDDWYNYYHEKYFKK